MFHVQLETEYHDCMLIHLRTIIDADTNAEQTEKWLNERRSSEQPLNQMGADCGL